MQVIAALSLLSVFAAFSTPARSLPSVEDCTGCNGIPGGSQNKSNSCGAIAISVAVHKADNSCEPTNCQEIPCEAWFTWGWQFTNPNGGNIVTCWKRSSGGGWFCDWPGETVPQNGGGLEIVPVNCGSWERKSKAMCNLEVITQADCTACVQ